MSGPQMRKCTKCQQTKNIDDFHRDRGASGGHAYICRVCRKGVQKQWTESHKEDYEEKYKMYRKKQKQRRRIGIANIKRALTCAQCGTTGPQEIFDMAHYNRETKKRTRDGLTVKSQNLGVAAWKRELEKCRFLCSFCHQLETHSQRPLCNPNYYAYWCHKQMINREKLMRGHCVDCGRQVTEKTLPAFDFDHRDGVHKVRNLAQMRSYSWEKIMEEFGKVDLRCTNCHRMRTAGPKVISNEINLCYSPRYIFGRKK